MDDLTPQDLFAFSPSRRRAEHMDSRVRAGLSDSLAEIFARVGSALGVDEGQSERMISQVRGQPIAPKLMATYTDLVEAIYADDEARARALIGSIVRASPAARGTRVLDLKDTHLGTGEAERYARYALAESEGMALSPVGDEVHARIKGLYGDAHRLLVQAAPELAGEIDVLLRELVLVQGADSHSEGFDGATTFYLWGALLLNAPKLQNRVQLAVAITHECAHALLFGFNLGAKLTLNDDTELCASPLRAEPRPIEGVFHATFVLARMIYARDRMLASSSFTAEERIAAEWARRSHVAAFRDGAAALEQRARLTSAGSQLLDGALAYALA